MAILQKHDYNSLYLESIGKGFQIFLNKKLFSN